MDVLLSTTYFGPVAWYKVLHRADTVFMEAHENYHKQTFRNRCTIGSEAGPLSLTVPVSEPAVPCLSGISGKAGNSASPRDRRITSVLVSDHGNWRHLHWQALCSAYRDTPFFPYYADDLRPFFERRDWPTLWQLNEATRDVVCQLLGIHPHIVPTQRFDAPLTPQPDGILDLRDSFGPKQACPIKCANDDVLPQAQQRLLAEWAEERPYWQPFLQRHGFISGLSILDLLFCMGPESVFYL